VKLFCDFFCFSAGVFVSFYRHNVMPVSELVKNMEGVPVSESSETIKSGLGQLGLHPILGRHCYLALCVSKADLQSVDILANYPNLMYVDVSSNKISDLRVLELLPTLVELNASWNDLTNCLDFAPALCDSDNAWSQGDLAVGSMLTLANFSHNRISRLNDLDRHPFLETLLLSHNSIERIQGLQSLAYLQVLDLSYNRISVIEGLDGLRLQELNLEGNQLESADGLAKLVNLSVLNISHNKIRSLYPLRLCNKLLKLEAGYNDIQVIKQALFLRDIPWLGFLSLRGNPCCRKIHYRYRILFRLPMLKRLDVTNVTAEEHIRTCNLFRVQGGDLEAREAVFALHFPGEPFEDFGPTANFVDDEQDLDLNTMSAPVAVGGGGSPALRAAAENLVTGIMRSASPPPSLSRPCTSPKEPPTVTLEGLRVGSLENLREGDRVEGNYRNHQFWYAGTISCCHEDGTYDIDYDDGESELRVARNLIREQDKAMSNRIPLGPDVPVHEGASVEGNYRGRGHWYRGIVSYLHDDGTVDVEYEDGEKEERIQREQIRLLVEDSKLGEPLHEWHRKQSDTHIYMDA